MREPTKQEIDRVLDWCAEADQKGSHHRGMTYEQGVEAAILWMRGDAEGAPDDD